MCILIDTIFNTHATSVAHFNRKSRIVLKINKIQKMVSKQLYRENINRNLHLDFIGSFEYQIYLYIQIAKRL